MTVKTIDSIPAKFIQDYIDILLDLAKQLGPDSLMGMATLKRAECVMDMVESYKKSLGGK